MTFFLFLLTLCFGYFEVLAEQSLRESSNLPSLTEVLYLLHIIWLRHKNANSTGAELLFGSPVSPGPQTMLGIE